jgi:hypothetical protein
MGRLGIGARERRERDREAVDRGLVTQGVMLGLGIGAWKRGA